MFMARIFCFLISLLTSVVRFRLSLQPENATLRHQLSATRRTFLDQHVKELVAIGFFIVPPAPASPWQNPYVGGVIGSLRRELLDHVIILDQRHLKRLLSSYLDYYNPCRTHRPLDQDAPNGRPTLSTDSGKVIEFPVVHGLHHYYLPKAA